MKVLDTAYLDTQSPGDSEIRFFLDSAEPDIVRLEINISPPGAGTLRLPLGVDDLLKLAARMHAVGMRARGEPPERGKPN